MSKLIPVVILFTVIQLTNCSPVKCDLRESVTKKEELIILNNTNTVVYNKPDPVPVQPKESNWVNTEAWWTNRGTWPRYIPYEINQSMRQSVKNNLLKAIYEIQNFTCLRFIPRTSYHRDYMLFANAIQRCSTLQGKRGGSHRVSLDEECTSGLGAATYIMLALGRDEEHKRPDRDSYIRINMNNIATVHQSFFASNSNLDKQGLPYDYHSLMHWKKDKYARSPGLVTIETTNPAKAFIGQKQRLSFYDILHLNIKHCPERVVRLVPEINSENYGRLEVFWNGQWGSVCDTGFDRNDANIFCKYMGYPGVDHIYTGTRGAHITKGSGPIWFSNMQCDGSEKSPFHCRKDTNHNCQHSQDVGLQCTQKVRLMDNYGIGSMGRVEVFVNGKWGTVCDDGFGSEEAKVVCRQLGFYPPSLQPAAYDRARFGQGRHPIMMDNLECTGEESDITHCKSETPFGTNNCKHKEDVGVSCMGRNPPY